MKDAVASSQMYQTTPINIRIALIPGSLDLAHKNIPIIISATMKDDVRKKALWLRTLVVNRHIHFLFRRKQLFDGRTVAIVITVEP